LSPNNQAQWPALKRADHAKYSRYGEPAPKRPFDGGSTAAPWLGVLLARQANSENKSTSEVPSGQSGLAFQNKIGCGFSDRHLVFSFSNAPLAGLTIESRKLSRIGRYRDRS
jgi:hypothetical protein